jgi:hypothetical protein
MNNNHWTRAVTSCLEGTHLAPGLFENATVQNACAWSTGADLLQNDAEVPAVESMTSINTDATELASNRTMTGLTRESRSSLGEESQRRAATIQTAQNRLDYYQALRQEKRDIDSVPRRDANREQPAMDARPLNPRYSSDRDSPDSLTTDTITTSASSESEDLVDYHASLATALCFLCAINADSAVVRAFVHQFPTSVSFQEVNDSESVAGVNYGEIAPNLLAYSAMSARRIVQDQLRRFSDLDGSLDNSMLQGFDNCRKISTLLDQGLGLHLASAVAWHDAEQLARWQVHFPEIVRLTAARRRLHQEQSLLRRQQLECAIRAASLPPTTGESLDAEPPRTSGGRCRRVFPRVAALACRRPTSVTTLLSGQPGRASNTAAVPEYITATSTVKHNVATRWQRQAARIEKQCWFLQEEDNIRRQRQFAILNIVFETCPRHASAPPTTAGSMDSK